MSIELLRSEISKGLWMIAPTLRGEYLRISEDLMSKKETLSNSAFARARYIREVIDPNGRTIEMDPTNIPDGSVGIIRSIGPMYRYGSYYSYGSEQLVAFAKQFDEHPNIIGQVWRDDSGGGTMTSIPPFLGFHESRQKPVVSITDMCASACYYKNCGTDHMMAENDLSAMYGSIGVMWVLYGYKKMMEEMGIQEHVITADPSEDKNKFVKQALEGKYKMAKEEYLNPGAIKFQEYVKAQRPGINPKKKGILSGKMFYAEEALELGMIDSIGNLEAAIDRVKFLANARSFITTL